MNASLMKQVTCCLVFLAFSLPLVSFAQTSQYTEKKEGEEKEVEENLEQLEKRYWVAKDSNFQVVQNRQYSKKERFFASALLGPLINDQYSDATAYSLSAGYFFSERWGAELTYQSIGSEENTLTNEFIDQFGVAPNHNQIKSYIGLSANWVPIYAKASLYNSYIMYFDFSVGIGLGILGYEQQFTDKANEDQSTVALALDLSQQVFLTTNISLRISYFARWFNEEVRDSRSPYEVRSDGLTQTNLILLGLTYFH